MMKLNKGTFLVQWVTAVTITMILATMGAFVSMWSVGEVVQEAWGEVAMGLVVGAIFGGLLGVGFAFGQAIVLRSQGISFGRWLGQTVLAGAVGTALGFTVMFNLFEPDALPEIVTGVMIALFVGLPIGVVQWQMLKPHVAQPQLWVPITTMAFLIGFAVGLPMSGEGREWLSIGVVALLTAAISGVGMVWLMKSGETAVAV